MGPQERYERIEKVIAELIEENEDLPVLVEGKRDEQALRRLGVNGEIIKINRGFPIPVLCERLTAHFNGAVVLTDWDLKGDQLSVRVAKSLRSDGMQCDVRTRERLKRYCKKEIKDVEGLPRYLEQLRLRGNGR